jgi:hypothetical protein
LISTTIDCSAVSDLNKAEILLASDIQSLTQRMTDQPMSTICGECNIEDVLTLDVVVTRRTTHAKSVVDSKFDRDTRDRGWVVAVECTCDRRTRSHPETLVK